MKLTIYGAGYVGLVTAVCMAELGVTVCCVDIDEEKITRLRQGQLPIYEENLEQLLTSQLAANRIEFTTDTAYAVSFSSIQMIAVGTPSREDGSANLDYVDAVAKSIAWHMTEDKLIVNKSTVPVGTADRVRSIMLPVLKERQVALELDVASNPEFLREGQALYDCLHPDRIIVGVASEKATRQLQQLYQPLIDQGYPFIPMHIRSAELTKYTANAFLATKISFINEMALIAEKMGANIDDIRHGVGMDSRISEKFLYAGCGFGGSCFPKDVSALKSMAEEVNVKPTILNAVLDVNANMQRLLFDRLHAFYQGDLKGKTFALWGLAFKPKTDDVRCATSRVLMELLWEAGASVQAYDPLASQVISRLYPNQSQLTLCDQANDALKNADALLVVTEWDEFKQADLAVMKASLNKPVLIDGRNIYDADKMKEQGFLYSSIGRDNNTPLKSVNAANVLN